MRHIATRTLCFQQDVEHGQKGMSASGENGSPLENRALMLKPANVARAMEVASDAELELAKVPDRARSLEALKAWRHVLVNSLHKLD